MVPGTSSAGRALRPAMVGSVFVLAAFTFLTGTFPGPSSAGGPEPVGQRGKVGVSTYGGPLASVGGVVLYRQKGTIRVEQLGRCTNAGQSPRIQVRGGRVDALKRYTKYGQRVKLRIKGRFSPNQMAFSGSLMMSWGRVSCTGGLKKFKVRKGKF